MRRIDRIRFWWWAGVLAVGIEVVWRGHRLPRVAAVGKALQQLATRRLLQPRP